MGKTSLQTIDPISGADAAVRDLGPDPNQQRGEGKPESFERISYDVGGSGWENLRVDPMVAEPAGRARHPSRILAALAKALDQLVFGHRLKIG
jgi:hypothetical protein